eukprot:MONOS_15199.1-p1 / transcript=MONOS_15199.1 / gene=MONOS_15199 / organism=Monocercomonoides_exilis_PA203 / gene_product=unspecified product / transcript_product=unspecified product / location=Mono_scaffold01168:6512-7672(-) / protein_length=367 / sequence_SO=supercontig / SO=protein_coding / is_pseudo=false
MSMENAILLLKCIGYYATLKRIEVSDFERSSLNERFEKMIVEEVKKKEKKNENLLIDLCECFALLGDDDIFDEILSIIVPCLLKIASKKDETEEAQKEVEIALLTLSEMGYCNLEQELYLKEISEIITHQQKHKNLSRLAYQSVWKFLINRFNTNKLLEDTVVNELHFVGEAARELEELAINVNWNRKKGEERAKEAKEEITLMRWLQTSNIYFGGCQLQNEDFVEIFRSISYVFRAAKDNHRGIGLWCTYPLINAVENRVVKVDALLKGRAIDAVLERMQRPTLNVVIVYKCLQFFKNVSNRLEEKNKDEKEEEERKATKRKIFEKMEEEGYEDTITSFHKTLKIFNIRYYYGLSLNISDYLVNV